MSDLFPDRLTEGRRRGRGAAGNPANRFDRQHAERAEDGWPGDGEGDGAPVRTETIIDRSRSIIARNASPDLPFDRSINPYRGCEHGCVYCFARPSHAQLGFSPGLDFETKILVKPRAAELLAAALRKPSYSVAPIAIGTNTDAYQPLEGTHRLMPEILEVLWAHRHPVTITTKGALVLRDLDILGRMARAGLATVTLSLTTLDNRLSRRMEPRAAAPGRRIAAIRALAARGVPVGANIAPVIPGLTDHEIEGLAAAAAEAGAKWLRHTTLRLPLEVATLWRDWLERECPARARKVMGKVREMHGGQDYDATWHRRLKGEGVHATLIARRVALARRRHGLEDEVARLRCDLFRVPPRAGDQLSLTL